MKKMTKKDAKNLVAQFMPQTGYIKDPVSDWTCTRESMEQMLHSMGFGYAEQQTILGSLVLAGAQIYE